MYVLWPILATVAIGQFVLAAVCFQKYSATRVPALLLVVVAPLQLLLAIFGGAIVQSLWSPSSFDPLGDWIGPFFWSIGLVVANVLLAGALCAWIAIRIGVSSGKG